MRSDAQTWGLTFSSCLFLFQVKTVAEYDKYCHYVAGLVGIGLSQLFGEQSCAVLTQRFDGGYLPALMR